MIAGRALVGGALGLIARAWIATLRVRVLGPPPSIRNGARPWVLAFFHGQQFVLLAWRRRLPTYAMVSQSRDGDIQAHALARLSLGVVRGSSSRGGSRALVALVRILRAGSRDVAFAVDGPRGPRGISKPGALVAARAAGGLVVPLASACGAAHTFSRTWCRYELPLPFSRVIVAVGAPFEPGLDTEAGAVALDHRLRTLRERAVAALREPQRVSFDERDGHRSGH